MQRIADAPRSHNMVIRCFDRFRSAEGWASDPTEVSEKVKGNDHGVTRSERDVEPLISQCYIADMSELTTLEQVRAAAGKRILFLPHAVSQMLRPDRIISTAEVRAVIEHGELVEDYPEDARGHSCLVLGFADGNRAIHVVCVPKEDYLAIITAYLPYTHEWSKNFKVRIKS